MEKGTVMLTTFDNPYNPFKDFVQWLLFDKAQGYDTCDYLGRIAHTSDSLSEEENSLELEKAVDEIIKSDPLNIYKKIYS